MQAMCDEPPHVQVVPILRAHAVHEGHGLRPAHVAANLHHAEQGLVGRVRHAAVAADVVVAVRLLQNLPQPRGRLPQRVRDVALLQALLARQRHVVRRERAAPHRATEEVVVQGLGLVTAADDELGRPSAVTPTEGGHEVNALLHKADERRHTRAGANHDHGRRQRLRQYERRRVRGDPDRAAHRQCVQVVRAEPVLALDADQPHAQLHHAGANQIAAGDRVQPRMLRRQGREEGAQRDLAPRLREGLQDVGQPPVVTR
mmetsp:Transcript_84595/g.217986  ORF Transcript_84595/g.217986 Transcript_84595/m.217986 type:complete len:259 (-) Transcript_84595:3381-4157(-)